MSSVRLPRLSRPDVLQSISPDRLVLLLSPFQEFFRQRKTDVSDPSKLHYGHIIHAIMSADRAMPAELIDAICMIDAMAAPKSVDALRQQLTLADLRLDPSAKHTAADIAVAAWLYQRERMLQVLAALKLHRLRAFDYFQSSFENLPDFNMPSSMTIQQFELDLDSWFEDHFRGRGSKIDVFDNSYEAEFSIRHGTLFRREETIDDGLYATVAYRPVQCDALIFNKMFGELRVHASTVKEKQLYCRLFGKHMFGDEECFPFSNKYSLEPLRRYGQSCLSRCDVEGVKSVRFTKLKLFDGGEHEARTTREAKDLFAWLESQQKGLDKDRQMVEATFMMKMYGCRDEKAIRLRPPNVAIYARGPESFTIENWLRQCGFDISGQSMKGGRDVSIVA